MNKLHNINVFVVPNGPMCPTNCINEEVRKSKETYENWHAFKTKKAQLKAWGIVPTAADPLIQVWFTSDEEGNLTDHGIPGEAKNELFPSMKPVIPRLMQKSEDEYAYGGNSFPKYIPYSIIAGKKEGDTFELTTVDGVTVTVTCRQLDYRYSDHGRFEEVVEKLVHSKYCDIDVLREKYSK